MYLLYSLFVSTNENMREIFQEILRKCIESKQSKHKKSAIV